LEAAVCVCRWLNFLILGIVWRKVSYILIWKT
jgi:hypothetical protein